MARVTLCCCNEAKGLGKESHEETTSNIFSIFAIRQPQSLELFFVFRNFALHAREIGINFAFRISRHRSEGEIFNHNSYFALESK